MAELREYDALVNRLRDELLKTEAEFRWALTPLAQRDTRKRYEQALGRYADLILRNKKPDTSAA